MIDKRRIYKGGRHEINSRKRGRGPNARWKEEKGNVTKSQARREYAEGLISRERGGRREGKYRSKYVQGIPRKKVFFLWGRKKF